MVDNAERNERNKLIIDEFRANEGQVGGPFDGIPLLLLHSRGAKSGAERINVTVEVGTRTSAAIAAEVTGAERDRVYAAQVARVPMFADYEKQLDRTIPVIGLELVTS